MQRVLSSSRRRQRPTSLQRRRPIPVLALSLVVRGMYYLATTAAIHLSVLLLRLIPLSRLFRRQYSPRVCSLLIGVWAGLTWALGLGTLAALLTHSQVHYWTALFLSVPLAAVVAWQVSRWQEATIWASHALSLTVGVRHTRPFFVRRPYALSVTERMKTIAITGSSGSGKSTWLVNAIVSDIQRGAGLCAIDPKDDLVDLILPHIPASRERDVILFDATDSDQPIGLNPLSGIPPDRRSLAASELIAVFRRLYAQSWGARMEHILTNAVLALLEIPGATLLDIPRLLTNPTFRQQVVGRVTNPGVRQFFLVEYEHILHGGGSAIEPILNKIGPWLTYPELRHAIGQPETTFNIREAMDQGKIILARLPKGILGEDVSALLAALLVAKVQLAAHSRVDTPIERRRPFLAYLDEAHNYATSSLEQIIVEGRAFKLGLVIANQYPEQLSRSLQLAVARNAATQLHCVTQRGRHQLELTRLEHAELDLPPLTIIPPPPLGRGDPERAARIKTLSRMRYGRPRELVEQELSSRFAGTTPSSHPRSKGKVPSRPDLRVDIDED